MDKLGKLEKLEELKKSGTLTEEEFENEKQKILNEKQNVSSKGNKKVSNTFFILSLILLVLTVAFVVISFDRYEEMDEVEWDYYMAKGTYEDYKDYRYTYRSLYEDAKEEYEELEEEYNEKLDEYHFYEYGRYVTGALCIVSIGLGIIFKEKKKKE